MKKTNVFLQKSYAYLYAIGFVLFVLSFSSTNLLAQNKSPLPPLVSVSEAIPLVAGGLKDIRLKINNDLSKLVGVEADKFNLLTFVLKDLEFNQNFVGYRTEYALHLAASQDIANQLQSAGASTIALDPFAWVDIKLKDPAYKYVVSLLKN